MYQIEKDVPLPAEIHVSDYPFRSMEVGDSFAAPLSEHKTVSKAAMNQNARSSRPRKHFSVRKLPTEVRVWRMK